METERGFILLSSNVNITQEENPTPTVKVDINGKLVNVPSREPVGDLNVSSYSRNLVSVDEQVQVTSPLHMTDTSIVIFVF